MDIITEEEITSLDKQKEAIIVVILSAKGGIGKTTISVNLSCGLAERGYKVALFDLDPNTSASSWLLTGEGRQQAVEHNLGNLLLNPKLDIKQVIQKISPEHYYDPSMGGVLDFIPASSNMAQVENQLYGPGGTDTRLKKVIGQIKSEYDYIFLDAPGKLEGKIGTNVVTAATHYLMPVEPSYLALAASVETDARLEQIKEDCNPTIKFIGVVINMYQKGRKRTVRNLGYLTNQFDGNRVFKSYIPMRDEYKNNPEEGSSYLSIKAGDAKDLMDKFVDEFLARIGGEVYE
jgi:chromosome partitioning protein